MEVGDLVKPKYTAELGLIVGVDETHCDVFIHKGKGKRDRRYRIRKEHLEVLHG